MGYMPNLPTMCLEEGQWLFPYDKPQISIFTRPFVDPSTYHAAKRIYLIVSSSLRKTLAASISRCSRVHIVGV